MWWMRPLPIRPTAGGELLRPRAPLEGSLIACGQPSLCSYMFGVAAIPAVIQFIGFLFLPESPRYLVSVGKADEALVVLQRLRGATYDAKPELDAIKAATAQKQGGIRDLLSEPHYRRILFLACMLQFINQITGINTIM